VKRPLQPVAILGSGGFQGRQASKGFLRSIDQLPGWGWLGHPVLGRPMDGRLAADLLAAVNVRQRRCRLVAEALQGNAWIHDITGVLSVPAIVQYLQLRERLDGTMLQQGIQDKVIWKWTSFGVYSAHSSYAMLTLGQSVLYGAMEAWKVRAPREHKFFIWLVLQDRC
jgi:hypothetical protein